VLELTQIVVQAEKMSFWEVAPDDERALVLNELHNLHEATQEAIAALEMRERDDATREKIEKLRTTNGRTSAEAATSRRLAKRLEDKL
jgi:delta 1-pyrroline-5-carboxylate dehydrogenase